ncbi:MAG TPA: fumarylacetoacetate hydrolase family protein [Afifellaceae bacterium]|nr:fumarylacetoacetate hydrolase family protein [Afifellaceae bacterium]
MSEFLPEDAGDALLIGRVWNPAAGGPSVVVLRGGELVDVTSKAVPTVSAALELDDAAGFVRTADGPSLGPADAVLENSFEGRRDAALPWMLAPSDLQAVKASGVTFVVSLLERVIEERAKGDPSGAAAAREEVLAIIGSDLSDLKPGSPEAERLKQHLTEKGMWSQYLEVGIGPDAEIFTKAQPLSAVGLGAHVGILPISKWNNPEPEVVLAVSSNGAIKGVTLGNDVNLRDIEGRSALLLGKCKDNNASASLGPFIRLLDDTFTEADIGELVIDLTVSGEDGFVLRGNSHMSEISRSPRELVDAALGPNHQYPDGMVLYLGTMFAPVEDRGEKGLGFTHHVGDVVTISSGRLGALRNTVKLSSECEPWTFGVSEMMRNLAARGLI